MKRASLFWLLLSSVLFSQAAGKAQSVPPSGRSPLVVLTESWSPCTVDEEILISRYLRQEADLYVGILEQLDLEALQERPEMDEEAAALLDIRIENLRTTLTTLARTLALIEKMAGERPLEYAHTAPVLWLSVAKDMSMENGNAKDLSTLGLAESNWPNIAEVALPRLFTRILEPRITELVTAQAR